MPISYGRRSKSHLFSNPKRKLTLFPPFKHRKTANQRIKVFCYSTVLRVQNGRITGIGTSTNRE
jgi:hypothetical protein